MLGLGDSSWGVPGTDMALPSPQTGSTLEAPVGAGGARLRCVRGLHQLMGAEWQVQDGTQSRLAGSHLFEELIHEAVSVHGDSDIVVVIAVLGLGRIIYM